MANSGWTGETDSRFDPKGRWDPNGTCDPSFNLFKAGGDITDLIKPSSVATQGANGGWTRLETPVSNSGDKCRDWQLPTGMADRSSDEYDVAAYVPGGAGGS